MQKLINKSLKIFARDKVKSPSKKFGSNGLRYNVSYLKKVFPTVTGWPINQQALFVDVVTYTHCQDPSFIQNMVFEAHNFFENNNYQCFNTTAIGNLAFVAVNYKGIDKENVKEVCVKFLENIKEYYKK
jgi:hypothetical protein